MPFGYSDDQWEAARGELRRLLIGVARRRKKINYSDAARQLNGLQLQPESHAFRDLLDEVSSAEHQQGRGLLTAVVVHKGGDERPGHGFFKLARSCGRQGTDLEIWEVELRRVWDDWALS